MLGNQIRRGTILHTENPFWSFSGAVYAAPGMQQVCLHLQDAFDADVNVLLLAAWIGAVRRQVFTTSDRAEAPGAGWNASVIEPLRVSRRAARMALAEDPAFGAFYRQLKQCELGAEQLRQALLFNWADARFPVRDGPYCIRENLCAVMEGARAGWLGSLDGLVRAAEDVARRDDIARAGETR